MEQISSRLGRLWDFEENRQQSMDKIVLAQELERRKWALEVHDGITQSLANIYYRLQAYKKLLPKDTVQAQRDLDEMETLVIEAIAEARGIIDDLRPSILDDVGLSHGAYQRYPAGPGRESMGWINRQIVRQIGNN